MATSCRAEHDGGGRCPLIGTVFAVLGLFVAQTLLPPTIRYLLAGPGTRARLQIALGPRDHAPPLPALGGRAERALHNLQEALPVFLTAALLHVIQGTAEGQATLGAQIFLAARVLYVPAYLSGVPGLRSAVWIASWAGLGLLLAAFAR
jgi:uncharacterized MAPEG superfamily protein